MVYHDRKRARGRPSIHHEGADVPPPPPPKRPSMCVKVKHHHLIPRSTLDIFLHGWKVKLDDGKYAKTWITDQRSFDQITPTYIPEKFDILGEKLDKAFLDIADTFVTQSLDPHLNDLIVDKGTWVSPENYKLPSEASLELPPLFSQNEATVPPPPPPPPPPLTPDTRMEAIGDQLENSQYSPTHTVLYEEDMDTRYSPSRPTEDVTYSPSHPTRDSVEGAGSRGLRKTSESSSDYLSADEDFPPPAPSPPSIPGTPSAPNTPDDEEEEDTITAPSLQESPHGALRRSLQESPHGALRRSLQESPHGTLRQSLQEPPHGALRRSLQEPPHGALRRSLQESPEGVLRVSFRAQRSPDKKHCNSPSRRTPSKTTPLKLLNTSSKRGMAAAGDDCIPQPMDLEDDLPPKICPDLDGEEFDQNDKVDTELGEEGDEEAKEEEEAGEEEEEEEALESGQGLMLKDVEDIDSPDELEEEDLPDTERDESKQPSQISLFREVLTDSGEIKRVLYFRKSKFRPTGTQLHQISKMSTKMDYEDACKNTGLPEIFNRAARPADLGTALTDRIEKPKKKLAMHRAATAPRPVKRNFGVPLSSITRSIKIQHDPSTAIKMKSFGIPLRQMRGPLLGAHPQRPLSAARGAPNTHIPPRPMNTTLTRSEQLISEFCACWVQRPFHDARCATTHDNFVEAVMKRHGVKYPVIKACILEYSTKIGFNINDPVRGFHLFKSIMKSKR